MRINTNIKNLTMDQSYLIVSLVAEWCEDNFPPPEIAKKNELCVMIHSSDKMVYGEYCQRNNWLTINIKSCVNIRDIVSTTIHEYTHLIQDLKHYNKFGYDDNPFEIEARENEKKYTSKCWKEIRKIILMK